MMETVKSCGNQPEGQRDNIINDGSSWVKTHECLTLGPYSYKQVGG